MRVGVGLARECCFCAEETASRVFFWVSRVMVFFLGWGSVPASQGLRNQGPIVATAALVHVAEEDAGIDKGGGRIFVPPPFDLFRPPNSGKMSSPEEQRTLLATCAGDEDACAASAVGRRRVRARRILSCLLRRGFFALLRLVKGCVVCTSRLCAQGRWACVCVMLGVGWEFKAACGEGEPISVGAGSPGVGGGAPLAVGPGRLRGADSPRRFLFGFLSCDS